MSVVTRIAVMTVSLALTGWAGYWLGARRTSEASGVAMVARDDHSELRQLYEDDQSDRANLTEAIDWPTVQARDRSRRESVNSLVASSSLETANDYYHAAMVLQHGDGPDDFILAHELAVAAVVKGRADARWLVAATEDRFLTNIGRMQRFGTQFRKDGDGPWSLGPVNPAMTDAIRRVMNVPPLADAQTRVKELNKTP